MTTITRERLTKILIETMALIKERSSRTGDASGISTEVNASLFAEVTRMALASLTAEPALYAAEETLAYAKMGELHLTCLSEPMGDAVIPLYAAPQAPVSVPVALNRLRSIVADPRALPRRKEWISGQQYSYVLLENVEAMVDDACRAALLQGSQPVSNRDELQDGWVACSERMPEENALFCTLVSTQCYYALIEQATQRRHLSQRM